MKRISVKRRAPQFVAVLVVVLASHALPIFANANEADVLAVKVKCRALVCDFAVTLKHADEGWKHYANGYEILSEDRKVLAKRELRHPHVDEQPFTRSLPGVELPAGTTRVIVRANDKVHGYGGAEVSVAIPPVKPRPAASSPD